MITSYDCEKGMYVVTTLDKDIALNVEQKLSDTKPISNGRFVAAFIYNVFSGTIVDRLAEYEITGYEPEEVAKLKNHIEVLESRLKHLLQSDFINSFDRKDPLTKKYTRDIKEADKLQKFETMECKDFKETIEQLEDLISDRESFLNGDDDEIYCKDITALETAIIAVKYMRGFETEVTCLLNDLEQEKAKNRLLKRDMLAKDNCISMQNQAIEHAGEKLNKLRDIETELERVKRENKELIIENKCLIYENKILRESYDIAENKTDANFAAAADNN